METAIFPLLSKQQSCTSFLLTTQLESGDWKKEARPGARTHSLCPNASFSYTNHQCGHDFSPPIAMYTVTGWPQYFDHLGPAPEGFVWWCAHQTASMCMYMSPRARDGWWHTVPISRCVVSKCYASWCINLYKLFAHHHTDPSGTGPKWL